MNSKITFPELIELVAEATNTSKRMSELFLKELFATVSQALINGESVRIKNLGQFKIEEVKSRKSVSVNTGQEVEIPSHNRLVFTPAKSLADALNEPFAQFETVVLDDDITDEQLAAINGDVAPEEFVEEPVDDAPENIDDESADEALETSSEDTEEEVVTEEPVALTPPPFMPLAAPVEEPVEEPETEPTEEPEEEPETEPAEEPVEEPETEPSEEPETEPQYEADDDEDDHSIVEFEKAKREIARKSTIRGAVYGALGMLALLLVGWGAYTLGMNNQSKSVAPTDTVTVSDKDEMSTGEQVMRQEIGEADTTAAPVEEPAQPKVVTDTCTKTMFLTRMAMKHYGSRDFWVYIYEENKDKLDNPNHITPGTVVVIPPAEKYGIDVNDPESVKQARIKSAQVFAKFPSTAGSKTAKKGKYRKK